MQSLLESNEKELSFSEILTIPTADKAYIIKSFEEQFTFGLVFNNNTVSLLKTQYPFDPCYSYNPGHKKAVSDICLDTEGLFITSSLDCTVKLYDPRSNLCIQTLKNLNKEIFSVSKSNFIIAGGCALGSLNFWDIRTGKTVTVYDDSHTDDVMSVMFSFTNPNILLTGSLDGMVCSFDINKNSEEEATINSLRLNQPINKVGFLDSSCQRGYCVSTANSITTIDLVNARKIDDVNYAIDFEDESNKFISGGSYESSIFYYHTKKFGLYETEISAGENKKIANLRQDIEEVINYVLPIAREVVCVVYDKKVGFYQRKFVSTMKKQANKKIETEFSEFASSYLQSENLPKGPAFRSQPERPFKPF